MFLALFLCKYLRVNNDENKNKMVEEAIEQISLILVAFIDEIHAKKKEYQKSSSEEIIN